MLHGLGAAYGLNAGIWLDVYAASSQPSLATGIALLGMGGGIAGAYLFSNHGQLRRGRGYSAEAGYYLGGLTGLILGVDARNTLGTRLRTQGIANLEFFSATGGMALGVLLGNVTDARPGSAAFVLTGGVWFGTLGVLVGEAASGEPFSGSRHPVGLYWTIGALLGAGGAFAAAHYLDMTPGRARWIDLGALAGLTVGIFLPIGTREGSTTSAKPSAVGGALGVLVGGLAAYFITGLSTGDPPRAAPTGLATLRPSFAPLPEGGGMLSLHAVM